MQRVEQELSKTCRAGGVLVTTRIERKVNKRHRIRDLIIYIAISLAIVGSVPILIHFKVDSDATTKWGGLVFFTGVLFGNFIDKSRRFLRSPNFWLLVVSLLAVHLAAFMVLLLHVGEWRAPWFIAMILEAPVFNAFRDRFVVPYDDSVQTNNGQSS